MTEQLNSPDNFQEEYHCYRSPAGAFVSIPFGQRDAYLAAGYVAVDSSNCGGSRIMGRRRMGAEAAAAAQGSPQGGGQGGAQGTPSPASPPGAGFFETRDPFYFPQYPLVAPPQYVVPPPGTTCAWEKDGNGNDVYVCRQASGAIVTVPPVASYGPVVYPAQSLFSRFY
jgi:hypothetical protein